VTTIGILHPGEMGAGIAGSLVRAGHQVLWCPSGRSAASTARAEAAGLTPEPDLGRLLQRADLVLSICPPHAARAVAETARGFTGVFVDANAVSPQRSADIAQLVEGGGARFVDGALIGGPPPGDRTRLYLSGPDASVVAELFGRTDVRARVIDGSPSAASALKMSFAAWSKGSLALILAARALAQALGVESELVDEWAAHRPDLVGLSRRAATQALDRGWRWDGEMAEIADAFGSVGLPRGFHDAAADVYRRAPRSDGGPVSGDDTVAEVLATLLRSA
jgi:3-hydroxyisobutyrate dehydrogenase-like beta-hydroxyacid dehydrogenase